MAPSMADQFPDDTSSPLFRGNPTAQIGDWPGSRSLVYVKHGQRGSEAGADARRETQGSPRQFGVLNRTQYLLDGFTWGGSNGQARYGTLPQHTLSHRPQHPAVETAPAVGTHHNQICILERGQLSNAIGGKRLHRTNFN